MWAHHGEGKDGTNNPTETHLVAIEKSSDVTEVEPEGKGHGDPKTVAGEVAVEIPVFT